MQWVSWDPSTRQALCFSFCAFVSATVFSSHYTHCHWSLVQPHLSLSIAFAILECCLSQTFFLIVPPLISMLSLSAGGDTRMGCGTEMLFGDFDCYDNTIFLHYYCTLVDTAWLVIQQLFAAHWNHRTFQIGMDQPKQSSSWRCKFGLILVYCWSNRNFGGVCCSSQNIKEGHAQAQESSANSWTPWSWVRWISPCMYISKMVMVSAKLLLPLRK